MTQVDSINANYYALQQAQQEAAQNPQFFAAPYAQGLAQDTVSFSGNGEEKKSHKGLKTILGLAAAGVTAYFLHQNWGKVSGFFKNLFNPVTKESSLKAAEAISKKAETSAAKLDKTFGLDKAAKLKRGETYWDAVKTDWNRALDLRRTLPGHQAAAQTTEQVMMSSYKPRTAEEIATFKEKAAAMKKKLGIDSFIKDLMAPKV